MIHLTKERRYVISSLNKRGVGQKEIAINLSVHKSNINRWLPRNRDKWEGCSPLYQRTQERFKRYRRFTSSMENLCRRYLEEEQWSPEEIVGYYRAHGIKMVGVERIHRFVREDKRRGGNLHTHLRHRLKHLKRAVSKDDKIRIKDRVSIDEKPEKTNNREEFGY